MNGSHPLDLENLWKNLLSRQPEQVRAVFGSLRTGEQKAVLAHLKRMAEEADWHPEQRKSAQAALRLLEGFS